MDSWDHKQIKTLSLGGNLRLKNLLKEYSVPENADVEFRYFIYVMDYYRRLLKSEMTGNEAPVKPDTVEGLVLLNVNSGNSDKSNILIYKFEDFEVYNKPISSEDYDTSSNQEKAKEKKGFFGKIGSFFEDAGKTIEKGAKDFGKKVVDMNIGDKLKTVGEKTIVAFKKAGDKIADTGNNIIVSS